VRYGKNGFFMVNDERLGTFFIFIKKGEEAGYTHHQKETLEKFTSKSETPVPLLCLEL
jgi:hypothetical protein